MIRYFNDQGEQVTGCSRGAIVNRIMGTKVVSVSADQELILLFSSGTLLNTGLLYDVEIARGLVHKALVFTSSYIAPMPETDDQEGFMLGFHNQTDIDVTSSQFRPQIALLVSLKRIEESFALPISK